MLCSRCNCRIIVETSIPDQGPINNLKCIGFSIRWGLNFDQARTQHCHDTYLSFECYDEEE